MTNSQASEAVQLIPRVLAPYGVDAQSVSEQHDFINRHIAEMEASENETIARSGFVLKRASEGFGIGYKVPLAVIAMGQKMLGIDLAVATPFLASNPAAFTAAALGAVFWGYQSLGEDEKAKLHEAIGRAFEFGVELIRNLAEYCIKTMKALLASEEFAQLRRFVAEVAESVGSSLYEVTGRIYDRVTGLANTAGGVLSAVSTTASETVSRGKSLVWKDRPDSE